MLNIALAVLLLSGQQRPQAPADTTDPYTSASTGNAYSAAGATIRISATKADARG